MKKKQYPWYFHNFQKFSLFDILKIDMIGNKDYAKFDASSKLLFVWKDVVSHSAWHVTFYSCSHIRFQFTPSRSSLNILYDGAAYKINSFIMIYMIYWWWQDVSPYKPQVVSELGPSIKLMEHLHFGEIPTFLWLAWFM